MLHGGNTGPAIVPGKSGESLLVEAITGGPNASPMPPKGPKLSSVEVALLKRWIDEGALGPSVEKASSTVARKSDHWAFQPVRRPALPEKPAPAASAAHDGWARTPIDRFILARLETAGLDPSPEADRRTLIRRVSLDLTGLPPSIAEVDAFLADTSEGAYERVVDRLLASPHYGERWGRHWLDLARYADSNGYTIDSARTIWKYRDWVIAALNRDLPYDRFAIEQIAGDMLPKATPDQVTATGFHRNTMLNQEGGTDQEQFRVEAVVDRVSTTGGVFLGLTLGCARCHDHKYDPISQREFYQFFALLNNADEPSLSLPTTQQSKELPAVEAELAAVEKRLAEADGAIDSRQKEWEIKVNAQFAALDAGGSAPELLAILAPLRSVLAVPRDKRTKAQRKLILEEYRKHDVERAPLMAQLDEVKQRQKQIKSNVTTTLVMKEREKPRETFVHLRGDFLRRSARRAGRARRARRSRAVASQPRSSRPPRPGSLAGRSQEPAHSSGRGQSHLAGVFRSGAGGHGERFRHARRPADASRTARLVGQRIHRPRLEHKGLAPADCHQQRLPPDFQAAARINRERSLQ